MNHTDPLKMAVEKLELAKVSSCDCCTKTYDYRHHATACGYRRICEAQEAVKALTASAAAKEQPQRKWRGIGELERTGYIPDGSAAEREAAALPSAPAAKDEGERDALPEGWRERLHEMRDASYTYSQYPDLARVIFDSVIDALDELQSNASQPSAQQQEAVAWLCTDLDGHGDVAFTRAEAKRRAGEYCNHFQRLFAAPVQQEAKPEGWFLPKSSVNHLVADSLNNMIRRAKHSHMADVKLRENGKDVWFEADWIKYMEEVAAPPQAEAQCKEDALPSHDGKDSGDVGRMG